MSSTVRTNIQFIAASSSSLLLHTTPEKEFENTTDNNLIVFQLAGITRRIKLIEQELQNSESVQSINSRVGALWRDLKIESCWNQFAVSFSEQLRERKSISESLHIEGKELVEKIKEVSKVAFNIPVLEAEEEEIEGPDIIFKDFWSSKKLLKNYVGMKNKKLQAWVNELHQSLYSQSFRSTSQLQNQINNLQKKIDEINLKKAQVFVELINPIATLTTRVVSGEHGDEIKQKLVSYSESIISFEVFLKLLLIDLCLYKKADDIKRLPLFQELDLTQHDVMSLRNILKDSKEEEKKIILDGIEGSLSFLSPHFKKLIGKGYELDNLARQYSEELKKLFYSVYEQTASEESNASVSNDQGDDQEDVEPPSGFEEARLYVNEGSAQTIDRVAESDVIDSIMSNELKLSTALTGIIQSIVYPDEGTIKELAGAVWEKRNTKYCLSLMEKISDANARKHFAKYLLTHSIVGKDQNIHQFLHASLKYYKDEELLTLFADVFETLSSDKSDDLYVYPLMMNVVKGCNEDVKEKFFVALFIFLETIPEKDIFFSEDHAPFTVSAIAQFTQSPEFLHFYYDERLLKSFSQNLFHEHKQAHEYWRERNYKKLEQKLREGSISSNESSSSQEVFIEITNEYKKLRDQKDELLSQLYAPSISLIAHILDGRYGDRIRERYLQGEFQENNPKGFFRLLLIHQIRRDQSEPHVLFNVQAKTDQYTDYLREHSQRIKDLPLDSIEMLIDATDLGVGDYAIKSLLSHFEDLKRSSKEYNKKTYRVLREYLPNSSSLLADVLDSSGENHVEEDLNDTDWIDLSTGLDDDTPVLEDDIGYQQDELLREYGLWADLNILDEIYQHVIDPFLMDVDGIQDQIKAFIAVRSEEELFEFMNQTKSLLLRARYIASYLLSKPAKEMYSSLKFLTSDFNESKGHEIQSVCREMFSNILSDRDVGKHGVSYFATSSSQQEDRREGDVNWFNKLTSVVDLFYEIYKNDTGKFREALMSFSEFALLMLKEYSYVRGVETVKSKLEGLIEQVRRE